MKPKQIFEKASLGNLVLKNRLVRSATWEALATDSGHFTTKLYEVYEELAKGGVGAIITGFTSVSESDNYLEKMLRLSDDSFISEHRKLVELCHSQNVAVISQIALGEYQGGLEADDMDESDIKQVERLFVDAAVRHRKRDTMESRFTRRTFSF